MTADTIRPGDKVAVRANWHPAGRVWTAVASVDDDELRLVTGTRVRTDEVLEVRTGECHD